MRRADAVEAAAMLRRLLAAVDAGELDAESPHAFALVRYLRGSAVTVELVAGQDPSKTMRNRAS